MNLLSSVEKHELIAHLQSQPHNQQRKTSTQHSKPFKQTYFQVYSNNINEFISQMTLDNIFEQNSAEKLNSYGCLHLMKANSIQIDPFLMNKTCEIGRIVKFSSEKPIIKSIKGVSQDVFEEFNVSVEEFEKMRDKVIPTELISNMKTVVDSEEQLWLLKKTPCTFPISWQKNDRK
ncbi:Hypothetical_protein [Hexamita inflata]|uniref:Hypothetical_protein n=1 Tax=Hexamita inflata TaxID=28002 RepID=A0AA86QJD3_9EUKA|nr:Hypothetical protein HINF_LOCUS48156 [Hexamita inflata]